MGHKTQTPKEFGLVVLFVFCGRNFKTARKAVWHLQEVAFNGTVLNSSSFKKICKRGFGHLDICETAAQHYSIFEINV